MSIIWILLQIILSNLTAANLIRCFIHTNWHLIFDTLICTYKKISLLNYEIKGAFHSISSRNLILPTFFFRLTFTISCKRSFIPFRSGPTRRQLYVTSLILEPERKFNLLMKSD